MRPRTKKIVLVATIVVAPFILGYAWWRHHFPYGYSHGCDLCLSGALHDYAATHDGAFPAGEATPEASLSLLYREKSDGWPLADATLLRGKTVPESVVKEILERGDLLTPDTCGWHYVEGLRIDDDPRLALFWDKAGLDHNGGRMAESGHIVMFMPLMEHKHIPEAEWERFLEDQRKLLAERKTAIHHDATVRIDNREVKVQVRVVDDYIYGSTWYSREMIATIKEQESGIQGLPVIPIEEIRNAKVVVEQDKARVRFVLQGREIIYGKSGFHIEETATDPPNK
jgi:hypothetical protein